MSMFWQGFFDEFSGNSGLYPSWDHLVASRLLEFIAALTDPVMF
jgi:hypothetical protein